MPLPQEKTIAITPPDKPPGRRFLQEETLAKTMGPVVLLTVIFFFNFMARTMVGSLLPAMESDLGISHTQSGLFIFYLSVGFFLSQIGIAHLAGAVGYRGCILLSLVGTALVAVGLGRLESVAALNACFLVLGMVAGLYVPSGISLITVVIRPTDWGKAMGIHEIAPNLGQITVPFLATAAVVAGSWRTGYLWVAIALMLLAVVHAAIGVDAHARPSPPSPARIRQIAANPSFWHMSLLLSLAAGVGNGVYAMLPLYLVNERGFDLAAANQLLGLSRIPGLIAGLLAGWITDRLGPRKTILIGLSVTGAIVATLAVCPHWFLTPGVFIQAAAVSCLFPPILSVASGISSSENRPLTFSMGLAIAMLVGGGLMPAGIAWAGDMGSFALGLVATGALTALGMAVVPFLKSTRGTE